VLMNLPRHALRLLRRIARQTFGAIGPLPRPTPCCSAPLRGWTLPASRIERPPDKGLLRIADFLPPPELRREALAVEVQVFVGRNLAIQNTKGRILPL